VLAERDDQIAAVLDFRPELHDPSDENLGQI
jgi:hypothetical protein